GQVARRTREVDVVQQHRENIRAALREPLSDVYFPDWETFLAENTILQEPEEDPDINNLLHCLYDSDCELLTSLFLGEQTGAATRPDYTREIQAVKYIYVSDASAHETKTIPLEVARLLKQIRKARPQARILLALEFAIREKETDVPIHFPREKTLPFSLYSTYTSLLKTTDKLDIDVLGLDDYLGDAIVDDNSGETTYRIKIGDAWVEGLDHSETQQILQQYNPALAQQLEQTAAQLRQAEKDYRAHEENWKRADENSLFFADGKPLSPAQLQKVKQQFQNELTDLATQRHTLSVQYDELRRKQLAYLHDFLSRTPWGIEQRNAQWERYIRAVSPFYDVIVTYAGAGHLTTTESGAIELPQRLAEPYVQFDFYTSEKLKEEDSQAYALAYQIQEQEGVSPNDWWEELEKDEILEYCAEYMYEREEEVAQAQPPLYIKRTFPSLEQAVGQDTQRQQVLQPYRDKTNAIIPHTWFTVFLPDYSKCRLRK
ncbi:MAG: hypothetical protein MJ053_07255, partial [Elusimicrobiaceae bacterium]|nr:hypothetical protein [Elusimicrobiaceae bacterium]